jgi:diguanylate cyclase (GGDEF)-like protein
MPPPGSKTDFHDPVSPASDGDEVASSVFGSFSDAAQPLAILGVDGQVVFSNPAFAVLFGDPVAAAALREHLTTADRSSAVCHLFAGDGRVVALRTAQLAGGVLLVADDISRPTAADPAGKMSPRDPVTQLGDRRTFHEQLGALLARPRPDIEPAAVLFMNLARFKIVNDALGHGVGDKLLRIVADRIRSAIGSRDFAARFAADEFAIIQHGQQPESAARLAERLIDLIGRSYIVDGHLVNIGATIGIAPIPPHGASYGQILRNANLALHHAKLAGRGIFRFFATAMEEEMHARRSLEIDLRRALALQEFTLVYQPQYNFATRRITGFETLLRWRHPTRGLVSPSEFIPLAEEIGLIVPIGEWVIRNACRDASLWPEPLNIAVNVSAIQFRSPELGATILSGISESGLAPERLELEITESALVTDQQAALDLLHEVRRMGVHVAMDDFGTGYSSLSYLHSFPFDKIKIDQSFIRGEARNTTGDAIVRAVASLGRSLGITTIAEGVETQEQLARMAARGCTDVQGYLISKPIRADEIGDFLRAPMNLAEAATALPPADKA